MGALFRLFARLFAARAATQGARSAANTESTVSRINQGFWIGESFLRLTDSISPTVESGVGIVAVGFPWSSNDDVYQFAIAVATGLLNTSVTSFATTFFISIEINHTEKMVKLELGTVASNYANALFAPGGANLIASPVLDPIYGGAWPGFAANPSNVPRPLVINVNGNITHVNPTNGSILQPKPVAIDDPTTILPGVSPGTMFNAQLPVGNGMYGKTDLLLNVPQPDTSCSLPLPGTVNTANAPLANTVPAMGGISWQGNTPVASQGSITTAINKLLGIM